MNRSFPLPVPFGTFAHRIFCWVFQWEQFLKTCSRDCVLCGHHQHLAVGWLTVYFSYRPAKQWLVFSW